jgi:hypothetical protein
MKKHTLWAGWFFILTSYTGATKGLVDSGTYTKTIIGGFASKAQCQATAANFPAPSDHDVFYVPDNDCRDVAEVQKHAIHLDSYDAASKCYRGTPIR